MPLKLNVIQRRSAPLIGAGTGGRRAGVVRDWIVAELHGIGFDGEVRVVCYRPH